MAINKPVKKGTNQRVSQAKGLADKVGKYKDAKTLNLKKSQLGASGQKASATRKIAISRTRYDGATKKVLGPMGKPITGRVDMGGGNIAVYKNGVRVRASSAKPRVGSGGGSGSGSGGGGNKGGGTGAGSGRKMIDRGPIMQGDRNPRPKPAGDSGTNRGPLMQGDRKPKPVDMNAPYRSGKTKPLPGVTAKERAINQNDKARAYPSRAVKQAQDKAAERALIMASLLPGIGVATRVGMGVRAGAAGMKALGAGAKGAKAIGPRPPKAIGGSPKAIEARATTGGAKISYGRPKPSGSPSRGLYEKGGQPTQRPGTTRPPKDAALDKYIAKLTPAQKAARTRAANAAKKKG